MRIPCSCLPLLIVSLGCTPASPQAPSSGGGDGGDGGGDSGGGDTGSGDGGDPTYGNFDPDHIVQVELTVDPDDWDTLRLETRTFVGEFAGDCMAEPFDFPYTMVPADIVVDGQSLDNIGIRKKGLIGSQSVDKPSLRINLDEYVAGVELFGTDNITLNNAVQDSSLIRQCMGYRVFDAAGVQAPRCNFAHVWVNGVDLGIYVHVEPIKRSFLRDRFGSDDGDLYEGTLSDFRTQYVATFDPKNSDTDDSLAPLWTITEALEGNGAVLDLVDTHFDTEALLSYLAAESIVAHWDGYAGNRNNFYVYLDPVTAKGTLIPWGADAVMQSDHYRAGLFERSILPNRMLRDGDAAARYEARVEELLDLAWDEALLLDEVDRMEALLASEVDISAAQDGMDDVRMFIERRRDGLLDTFPASRSAMTPPYCMEEAGEISATFETTWGSFNTQDVLSTGTVEGSFSYYGTAYTLDPAGGVAGSSQDNDLLQLAGRITAAPGAVLVPYFLFDPGHVDVGSPMPIDLSWGDPRTAYAVAYYTDASMQGQYTSLGYLSGGTLQFDAFSTASGAPVSGTVNTFLWGWVEVD